MTETDIDTRYTCRYGMIEYIIIVVNIFKAVNE